ncbi:MAG: antitoxin VbhA family protein [Syntrophomonas sp.]
MAKKATGINSIKDSTNCSRAMKRNSSSKKIIASACASMEMEGLKPSKTVRELGKHYLDGKISSKEAVSLIKEKHAAKYCKRG